jgi:hypothetical protein
MEAMSKILTNILKLITVCDDVKTNVLGFRDNNVSHDIQRYVSNDHSYGKFLARKVDECKYLSNFPAVTLKILC